MCFCDFTAYLGTTVWYVLLLTTDRQVSQEFTCQYQNIEDASKGDMKRKPQDALWERHHVQTVVNILLQRWLRGCLNQPFQHLTSGLSFWFQCAKIQTWMVWKVSPSVCLLILNNEHTLLAVKLDRCDLTSWQTTKTGGLWVWARELTKIDKLVQCNGLNDYKDRLPVKKLRFCPCSKHTAIWCSEQQNYPFSSRNLRFNKLKFWIWTYIWGSLH